MFCVVCFYCLNVCVLCTCVVAHIKTICPSLHSAYYNVVCCMTNVFLNWYLFQHFFRVNGNTVKQEWQCKEYLLSESLLLNHVLVRGFKSILVGCNVISLILMTAAFGCSSLIYFGAIICSLINTCILGGFTYQWENFKVVFLKSTLYFLVAFCFLKANM